MKLSTQPIGTGRNHPRISKEQSIVNTPVESTDHKQSRVNNTTNVQQHNPAGVLKLSANSSHNPPKEPFVAVSSSSVQPSVLQIGAHQQFRIPNTAFSDRTILKSVQPNATHPLCTNSAETDTTMRRRARVSRSVSRAQKRSQSAVPYRRQSVSKTRNSEQVLPEVSRSVVLK